MDLRETARHRLQQFVDQLPRMNTLQVNVEFQAVRNLVSLAPDVCVPLVPYMAGMIKRGGHAWQSTMIVARALVENAPELHASMRSAWRDPLLFQILSGNADSHMRNIATRLDLASTAPEQGSLGVARAMTANAPRPLFIVGAGFSYDSMPLTNELEALLCGLLASRGITDPARVLAEDWEAAWRIISKDPERFKQRFIGFSLARRPAIQHAVLATALAARTVVGVVSFNWDDHIERSGGDFPIVTSKTHRVDGPGLWKMHGDVNTPEEEWIWPHDAGRPLENVCEYVLKQAREGEISHVVVVGYAERETKVIERLLTPLQQICPNWVRVRPHGQVGPGQQVVKTARQFMGELDSFQRAVAEGLI